jgi:hypothetical protein
MWWLLLRLRCSSDVHGTVVDWFAELWVAATEFTSVLDVNNRAVAGHDETLRRFLNETD